MTSGLIYALLAMTCFGIADIVYKRAAIAGARPDHLLMLQTWIFTPSVAVYGIATGTLAAAAGCLWGAFAGFFMWFGFYNFAHSLKSGAITVNGAIFRLSFILTAILAVLLLHEALTPAKIAGIALAVAAVFLLLGGHGVAPASRESRSSLTRVAIATLSVGFGNLIYKYGLSSGATPASLVVAQGVVAVASSTAATVVADKGLRPTAIAARYAPFSAVALALAFVFQVEGIARGDVSTIVPIAQMGLAVSACLGFLLLHEPFTGRKALGIMAALAALAGFALG